MNQQFTTPFLMQWQSLVILNKTHHVARESDKKPGRIVCTDFVTSRGVGLLCLFKDRNGNDIGYSYNHDGDSTGLIESGDERLTIVPNAPKSLGWYGWQHKDIVGPKATRDELLKQWPNVQAIHEFKEGDGLTNP